MYKKYKNLKKNKKNKKIYRQLNPCVKTLLSKHTFQSATTTS